MKRVYTAGYSGRTPEELLTLANRLDADVFDIRLSPRSRRPEWNKGRLAALLGERYRHVPNLGNLNYRGDLGEVVRIANIEAGIEEVKQHPRSVILLCQCKAFTECHRKDVAESLDARNIPVTEACWPISVTEGDRD